MGDANTDVARFTFANSFSTHEDKWVRASDYDELAAKLAECEAERKSAVLHMVAATSRISEAETALKTARRDAFNEAAEMVESSWFGRTSRRTADAIRALIEEDTKT